MNQREVITETRALADARGWETDSPQETYLLTLLSAREDARHSLTSHIKTLRNDLDRLDQMLRNPSPLLNTLGELQQRPAAVEAAVGEFTAADKALRLYLETFPAEPMLTTHNGEQIDPRRNTP